jgi:hypothetical protein
MRSTTDPKAWSDLKTLIESGDVNALTLTVDDLGPAQRPAKRSDVIPNVVFVLPRREIDWLPSWLAVIGSTGSRDDAAQAGFGRCRGGGRGDRPRRPANFL